MRIETETLQNSTFFQVTADLSGVQIDQTTQFPTPGHIAACIIQTVVIFSAFLLILQDVPAMRMTILNLFEFFTALLVFSPILWAIINLMLPNILPRQYLELYQRRVNITDSTLILPGWLFASRRTLLLDSIISVSQDDIQPSISTLLSERPTGKGIEIETEDGTFRFKFDVPWKEQQSLIQLIQQAVTSRKQRLHDQGHDLFEKPVIPQALVQLRQRQGTE